MKVSRLLPVLVAGVALSACAMPWQVAEVQDAQTLSATAGTPFTKALTEEYKAQSAYESNQEQDWLHALTFSRKAQRAATGEVVPAEEPGTWDLPATADLAGLTTGRSHLMDDFAHGARERLPAASAKAQGAYDCWVEEESEGEVDSACKKTFLAVEPTLRPMAAPAPVAHVPTVIKTFVVFFDFDRSALTHKARAILHEVAAARDELHPTSVYVSGYTDTVGSRDYNMELSQRRARRVAMALEKLGVQSTTLDVKAYGKEKLAVPTKDNARNAANRRVVITFEK